MFDDQQCSALCQAANECNGTFRLGVAHASGRLVKQNNVSTARHGDSDFKGALLGIGEQARQNVPARQQIDVLKNLRGALANLRQIVDVLPECVAVTGCPEHGAADILPHGHVGKYVSDLKTAREATPIDLVRPQARNNLAFQKNTAGGRRYIAADQVECGRFSGAVRPDDRMAFALGDGQIQIMDDFDIAKAFLNIAQLDRGRCHAWTPFSRATVVASSHARPTR